jgi:hypothetical protein
MEITRLARALVSERPGIDDTVPRRSREIEQTPGNLLSAADDDGQRAELYAPVSASRP